MPHIVRRHCIYLFRVLGLLLRDDWHDTADIVEAIELPFSSMAASMIVGDGIIVPRHADSTHESGGQRHVLALCIDRVACHADVMQGCLAATIVSAWVSDRAWRLRHAVAAHTSCA